jgi:hypothetical protein
MSKHRHRKALQRATPGQNMPGGATMYVPAHMLQSILGQTFYGSKANIPTQNSTAFSPGTPLAPQSIVNKQGFPVQYPFQIAANTFGIDRSQGKPDIPSFQQLRNLAKLYSGITLCERAWFDMVPRMQLKISLRPECVAQGAEEKNFQKEISFFKNWFEKPDGRRDIHTWLRMALREQTQIDELYLYKNKTRGGKLLGLHVVAGDTMKPLLNDWGDIPLPSDPEPYAFQQYPWGIPGMQYTLEQMIHYQESPAADSPYGQSRVERVIMEVNQALRKKRRDLAMFTEGNMPSGIMEVPESSNWTPDLIDAYEQSWNALIAGNPQQQVRVKFTQPGMRFQRLDNGEILTDFDMFLLNITTGCYGMSMQDISFTGDIHKSSGDSQQNVLYRRTIGPLALVYGAILTDIMANDFDPSLQGNKLMVSFGGFEESEDIGALASAYSTLTNSGILGLTNAAKLMKLPEDPDAPHIGRVIITKSGPIFLDDMASDEMRNAQQQAQLAGFQLAAQNPGGQQAEPGQDDEEGEDDAEDTQSQSKTNTASQPKGSANKAASHGKNDKKDTSDDDNGGAQERSSGNGRKDAITQSAGDTSQYKTPARSSDSVREMAGDKARPETSRSGNGYDASSFSTETHDTKAQQRADFRRWRDIALKDIKSGKPIRSFASDAIDAREHAQITEALARCTNADDVRAVFKRAQEGDVSFFAVPQVGQSNGEHQTKSSLIWRNALPTGSKRS